MELKIMLTAALFFVGWLWSYFFIRQLLFNYVTAYPLIRKMNSLKEDLIAIGAKRYTAISVIACTVVSVVILAIVVLLCRKRIYLLIGFAVGAVLAVILLVNKMSPKNRLMFDNFCKTYYQFVPDDELRTAMYNCKPGQMKARLKAMEISDSFIPEFEKNS